MILYIVAFTSLAFGISLTLKSDLTALPFDIFVKGISEKSGRTIKYVKTLFDITCVTITIGIALILFKDMEGIGIGTLFSMLFTGNMIQIFSNLLEKYFIFTPFYKKYKLS